MSIETPLLLDTVANAVVDYKGRQVLRSNSGGWRSACFIIGVEVAERFAYYGISCNLEMYLTEQLGQSTVTAAENVNTWSGTPLLLDTVANAVVDYKGRQVLRSNSGGWRSACFIIGVEVAERFAYYGISCNLEMYLTEQLGQSTVTAAENVNTWFLNKALQGKVCTISDVEEAKAVLRLIPIWATSLGYAIVVAQTSTFFTEQGATLDRTIFPGFEIPAASLQFFIGLAIVFFIPVYDRIFVPIARAITTKPFGITMLQRIGTGMLLSIICMVVAALVEIKRLKTAKEYGLVDMPDVTIPMSVWWLLPQYVLSGIADVFTIVGLQEFFYDQVPSELRSVGLALYLSILGVGSFLSSFLISIIEEVTGGDGKDSWFADNLNRAHLDYFYWLLAGISAVAFTAYLYFAKSYIYNRPSTI
nr:protein nrt1/ ptr family 5.10 [Quercus suber]